MPVPWRLSMRSSTSASEWVATIMPWLEACRKAALRARFLPFPCDWKAEVIATSAIPRGLYGCTVSQVRPAALVAAQRTVARALVPKHRRRCTELVLTLLFAGHRVDPEQATLFQRLAHLRRMLVRRDDLRAEYELSLILT